MVAEPYVFENRRGLGGLGDVRGSNLIIQAPSHVVGIGLAAVAPPGVGGVGGRRL